MATRTDTTTGGGVVSARVEIFREVVEKLVREGDGSPHNPTRYVGYATVLGGWRWRFVKNGRTMADGGQSYSRRIDCLTGCAKVLGGDVDKVAPMSIFRVRWDIEARDNDEYNGEDIPVVDLTREAAS